MGCGTAILAIGAARLWKSARILACDNDAVAVKVSKHNLKVNRIAARSHAAVSDGYKMRVVRRAEKQEIIVANILAKPLMRMARDAKRQLAPGGTLILSGLLNSQQAMVLAAHRAQGLYLKRRLRYGQWMVLVVG
jgi:ribosomal protein L11 methyltransferase